MDELRVRPMSASEFEVLRARLISEYAAEHVRAGNWNEEEAEARAAAQTDELLPEGVKTPGVLWLVAETKAGESIGHVWVGPQPRPGAKGAWIYAIEIDPGQRGKGYGRALLDAAEKEAARHGFTAIGLNVFGPNTVARNLYESAGYEVSSLQMHKELPPAD
ncbi:MAG: GNAT family N-acetyltransferase [Acidimicrobiales bacterium]|jgi:ribosomal protein S18 acetylase RimI-like enzyme